MHVGLPFMKLSLSPSTQKHKDKKARTCSVKYAWNEMRDLRRGRDQTIDRTKTQENIWMRGSTDMDMEAVVQKYIDRVNADKKEHGKRSLRCDAVTGIEMIEKPPMEYMEKLSREDQISFLQASSAVVDEILKEWNRDWVTVAQVVHFDEFGGKAPHTHRIIVPLTKDKDGILAFNAKAEFNLKFFTFINKEYPRRMRDRGYEVEDCKIYEQMSEKEKEEHRKNRPDYGLEGFEYKRKKQQELDEKIVSLEGQIEKQAEKMNQQLTQILKQESEIRERETTLAEKEELINKKEQVIFFQKEWISGQEEKIETNSEQIHRMEVRIAERSDELAALDQEEERLNERVGLLKSESRNLKARILSQKEVDSMKTPPKTLGGDYKVSPAKYRNLVATARRVGMVAAQEKRLREWEEQLKTAEEELEKKRRMPVKERMELNTLRAMKKIVVKVIDMMPEGIYKEAFKAALDGTDVLDYHERLQVRARGSNKEII